VVPALLVQHAAIQQVLKTSFENTPQDQVIELSRKIATRYREAAILLHGKPDLEGYTSLIKSFVTANGYYFEFSKHAMAAQEEHVEEENEDAQSTQEQQQQKRDESSALNDIMIIRFNISYKFSQFLGNVYRILLEEFCTIKQFELTETLVFIEYKKR
jgi:flagellar biosynthesis component FlhA